MTKVVASVKSFAAYWLFGCFVAALGMVTAYGATGETHMYAADIIGLVIAVCLYITRRIERWKK